MAILASFYCIISSKPSTFKHVDVVGIENETGFNEEIAIGGATNGATNDDGLDQIVDDALDETDVSGLGCGIAQRLHKLALSFDPHSHQAILLCSESFHNLGKEEEEMSQHEEERESLQLARLFPGKALTLT